MNQTSNGNRVSEEAPCGHSQQNLGTPDRAASGRKSLGLAFDFAVTPVLLRLFAGVLPQWLSQPMAGEYVWRANYWIPFRKHRSASLSLNYCILASSVEGRMDLSLPKCYAPSVARRDGSERLDLEVTGGDACRRLLMIQIVFKG